MSTTPGPVVRPTSRLRCRLTADVVLGSATMVEIVNRYRVDRVGWRELTAAGVGVRIGDRGRCRGGHLRCGLAGRLDGRCRAAGA